ncbi:MAG: hypothetical protein AAFO03_27310 [Bacteroidota bacterium]
MKTATYALLLLLFTANYSGVFAQVTNVSVSDLVLQDISDESNERTKEIEERIYQLDARIQALDTTLLQSSNSDQETMEKLQERILTLEEKLATQKSRELSVFQANFQTAVINLVSMENEIKPLELFEASKDFYSEAANVANPTRYEGFNEWFRMFRQYLENNKARDETLMVAAGLLENTNNFTSGIGIGSALSNVLFTSISKFITSLGNSKGRNELREESREMFLLIMTLSQYTADMNEIMADWTGIGKELEELKGLHDMTLQAMMNYLQLDPEYFRMQFLEQTNASNTLDYLNHVKNVAGNKVRSERDLNGENWKDALHHDMETVRSLKIRFGQATMRIFSNLQRYKDLIEKYEHDEAIGLEISQLNTKLDRLSAAFDNAFRPQKYVSDAVTMYKVY